MMNIQRFTARTSREALSKAKLAFGEGTLILSNRPTDSGVEVIATGEDTLAALDRGELAQQVMSSSSGKPMPSTPLTSLPPLNPNIPVLDDATQLAMSTLSFQDYVRERMLRRRHEAMNGQAQAAAVPEKLPTHPRPVSPVARPTWSPGLVAKPVQTTRSTPSTSSVPATTVSQGIVDELQSMKSLIEERFNTLTWLGQARQNPIQSNLMLKLIQSGYSPTLARTLLERIPEGYGAAEATQWVMDVLVNNLKTDAAARPIHEEGGIYALVGATGVGKTTTAAKLAGLCASTYGAHSVGLITLDTYRVGAHEQLRTYGRMLGVVAHLAHDRAALHDLLSLLTNKKMVLIDTTGIAPSDPRKRDMLDVLDLPDIHRLLVLNAGGHGDTLDGVITSFKTGGSQQAILSKIDEAAKMGPSLDASIRHQLVLRGVTMGQKVPEDWDRANAAQLISSSMHASNKSAYDPKDTDLGFFFAQSTPMQAGRLHA